MMEKYSRHIVLGKIGNEGQKILRSKKVLVVGLGGTGGLIAELLTRAGIGTLYISDKNYVTSSNIHRQVLFSEKDAGKFKVDAARNYLKRLNSDVKINHIYDAITSSNVE
jgi:adenylyltransferase/sulfurtransferase